MASPYSGDPRAQRYSAPRDRLPGRARRIVLWSVAGVVLVLLLGAGWVGIRGLLAKNELQSALPYAKTVQSSITSGDLAAAAGAAKELRRHAVNAAAYTDDPIWRAAELVPFAGPNFTAVRTAAAATDTIAVDVIMPLVGVAHEVDPARIKPVKGAIDLAPLSKVQLIVTRAQNAFDAAAASVGRIDTAGTLGPVADAVDHLRTMLATAKPAVDAVGNSARLLPGMLGADGPRTYLLLAQNPAELRATGGLVGALALIRADHGKISLGEQVSGTSLLPFDAPVSVIPAATQGLYGPLLARYIQDVNLTPDFPLAARTATAMWTAKAGGHIDGVVTIDPVALSYILEVTGPVNLPTGDILTSKNAVPLLLSDVYQRWSDPAQQDAFFSAAAKAVFEKVASGSADGAKLVSAFVHSANERRMLLWSAHPVEQRVLASTTLAGTLPASTATSAGIGVYFNDATGAKMDYYLRTEVEVGSAVCRIDGKPSTQVTVTLTNAAPADSATSLPAYVTGNGTYGVPPGSIRTRVAVYGAQDGLLTATRSGSADYPTIAGTDSGRPVSVFTVELRPGQSKSVTVDLLDVKQNVAGASVTVTPTIHATTSTPDVGGQFGASIIALDCGQTVK
jgi:hypothetical protein